MCKFETGFKDKKCKLFLGRVNEFLFLGQHTLSSPTSIRKPKLAKELQFCQRTDINIKFVI